MEDEEKPVFSDDEELAKLLFDIESKKPAVTKILLSGRAISGMDTLMPEAVSAERTLHIAFTGDNDWNDFGARIFNFFDYFETIHIRKT